MSDKISPFAESIIDQFLKVNADTIQNAIRKAVESERESCAQECDRLAEMLDRGDDAYQCAAEIRKRGEEQMSDQNSEFERDMLARELFLKLMDRYLQQPEGVSIMLEMDAASVAKASFEYADAFIEAGTASKETAEG